MIKHLLLTAMLTISCLLAAEDTPLPGMALRVTFDKDGATARTPTATLSPLSAPDKMTIVPGRGDGFAYRLAKGDKQLRYPAAGIAKPTTGTASIWAKADNFEPYNKAHGGWSIRPITLFSLRLDGGGKWMTLRTVIYRGADDRGVRTYLNTSEPPFDFGSHPSVPIPLGLIHEGEWHLFTCTWTTETVEAYIDGKFIASTLFQPNKAKVLTELSPSPNNSSIYIRGDGKEQSLEREENTDVGEFTLFNRVLSPAEIRSLFLAGPDGWPSPKELVTIESGGAFQDGRESVRIDLDFTMLERHGKHGGKRKAQWNVTAHDGKEALLQGDVTWSAENPRPSLRLSGLEKAGDYDFHLDYQAEQPCKMTHSFSKPDTSWVGNTIGREDTTPPPWIPPQWSGKAKVQIWNRLYDFTDSALPRQVSSNGRNLLSKPVTLKVIKEGREEAATARIRESSLHGSYAEFLGTVSTSSGFKADFRTTLEFDGFVHTELTSTQECTVDSITLDWTVANGFRDYLLTPRPVEKTTEGRNLLNRDTRQLWLASETGGFCWMTDCGRNWVNDHPENSLEASRETGTCRLKVIDHNVTIPAKTKWSFFFIATPTRPPMPNHRTWRAMNGGNNGCCILYGGFQNNGYLLIDETAVKAMRTQHVERGIALYASAQFLYSTNREASWFFRDWLGAGYFYGMGGPTSISLPGCIATCKADYLIDCAAQSINMPTFNLVDGFYFDCTGVGICRSTRHGCAKPDNFGRVCPSSTLLPLRDFMKRLCRLMHPGGWHIGAHGQYSFCPGVHGLCDYWLTGEELRGKVLSKGAGLYCDMDAVPLEHLRSVSDSKVFCNVNVLELLYTKTRKANETDADDPGGMPGLTRMVAEDIKVCWAADGPSGKRLRFLQDTFNKYQLDDAECHRWFEQSEYKCDKDGVKFTWYKKPDSTRLLAVCNFTTTETTAAIHTPAGIAKLHCEDTQQDILPGEDGSFQITLPPYGFILLAH